MGVVSSIAQYPSAITTHERWYSRSQWLLLVPRALLQQLRAGRTAGQRTRWRRVLQQPREQRPHERAVVAAWVTMARARLMVAQARMVPQGRMEAPTAGHLSAATLHME